VGVGVQSDRTKMVGDRTFRGHNPQFSNSMLLSRHQFSGVLEGCPMSVALRPLNTGELLDRTFSLYRSHFALFLGIVAIPHLFLLAFQLLGVAILPNRKDLASIGYTMLWLCGYILVSVLVAAVSQAATVIAVSNVYLDRPASVLDSFSQVKDKILGVVFLSILTFFAVVGASMLLFVPGILLTVRWSLSIQAKVLEDLSATDAWSRSSQLSEGNRWRIFVIWLLFVALSIAVAMLVQWPVTFASIMITRNMGPSAQIWAQIASAVSSFVSQCLVAPLSTIAFSLVYYDERVRKEAFDLQLMMTTLDSQQQLQPAPA